MLGDARVGEVVDLVRVLDHVVELLGGHVGRGEDGLNRRQLPCGGQLLDQVPDRVGALLVVVGLEERALGHEVADVAVAGVADRPEAEDGLVAAVARAEDVAAGRRGVIAEEDLALHRGGLRPAGGHVEQGRQEVDRRDQAVVHGPGLVMLRGREGLRPADDQRDVQPLVVAELLAPDVRLAVVAREDDDRRLGQPVGLELLEDPADLLVELAGGVEILGVVLARDRVVGIVRAG